MPEHDEIDRLLDSALSTYATPRPGLEDRVLRSLRETRAIDSANRPLLFTHRWLPWTIAVPIAAALALFFLLSPKAPAPPRNSAQSAPHFQLPVTPSLSSQTSSARSPARAVHPIHRRVSPASQIAIHRGLPKQNIFPSPQPLSPEEHALVAIAAHGPEPVRQSLIEAQNKLDAPITISAIQIQPLKMPDPGQN